jgi:hypothetical protein
MLLLFEYSMAVAVNNDYCPRFPIEPKTLRVEIDYLGWKVGSIHHPFDLIQFRKL